MAELSRFYGLVIAIFFRGEFGRHNRPHVHVFHGEHEASIAFDGDVLSGRLPPTAKKLAKAWIKQHRAELAAAWRTARDGRVPRKIAPLK